MTSDIRHDREGCRFETRVDGVQGELDYRLADGVMHIEHTNVPEAIGGRGIASALVGAAVQAARAEGWKVAPACSYAAAWMRRHPEFSDLLA